MVISRAVYIAMSLFFFCGPLAFAQEAPRFKLDDFRKLRFVEGRWQGAGYIKPFYEKYVAMNDSTIRMQSSDRADFSTPGDSSILTFRGGQIRSRDDYEVIRIDRAGVHFARVGRTGVAFIWKPETEDSWTALLSPAAPKPTKYTMTRLK